MFYYYGAKNTLAKHYQEPKFNTIIEPFAGSAAYACYHLLRNPKLKAKLYDKDDKVAEAWDFLLRCSPRDIAKYKTPKIDQYTEAFLIKTCTVSNASAKCKRMKYTARLARVFEIQQRRLLNMLHIRERITFKQLSYEETPNQIRATVFIDPPYQVREETKTIFQNGNGYAPGCCAKDLDFSELAAFCTSRKGHTIVCEKQGADWLPFEHLRSNKTSLNRVYSEVVWYNN